MKKAILYPIIFLFVQTVFGQITLPWEMEESSYHVDSQICYTSELSNWERSSKATWNYIDNKQMGNTWYNWNGTGSVWELTSEDSIVYNTDGKEIERYSRGWDHALNMPEVSFNSRIIFTYDMDGRLFERFFERRESNTSAWKGFRKDEQFYGLDSLLARIKTFGWVDSATSWTHTLDHHYSYDSLMRLKEEYIEGDLLFIGQGFFPIGRYTYSYNAANQLIDEIVERWAFSWTNEYRLQYVYNTSGLLQTLNASEWYTDSLQWFHNSRTEFIYDPADRIARVDGYIRYDVSSNWTHTSYCDYFTSSNYPTAIEEELTSDLSICSFSNPYREGSPINCAQLEAGKQYEMSLHDLQGRLIVQESFRPTQTLQFDSSIPSGLYVLRIRDEQQLKVSQKIVITD